MESAAPGSVVFFLFEGKPVARVALLSEENDPHQHLAIVHGHDVDFQFERGVRVVRVLAESNVPSVLTSPSNEEILVRGLRFVAPLDHLMFKVDSARRFID